MVNSLVENPTWYIIDPSKMKEYMGCPRQYFFRHILGWEIETNNVNLVFGEAWHRAMRVLLLSGKTDLGIASGYQELEAYYRENFPDVLTDETRSPKTPSIALTSLIDYCEYYKSDDFEVIETEVAGTVPINPEDISERMSFRIDAICKDSNGYFVLEHKTGSRESEAWKNQWELSVQVGLYIHTLFCIYPQKEVWGARVNGAIFRRTKGTVFIRVPVRRTPEAMVNWMIQTQTWYKRILEDTRNVLNESALSPAMTSFPMNTENCTKYKTCPYHDFCVCWNNPLQRLNEGCPDGFIVNFWNPEDVKKRANKVIDL